MMLTRSSPCRSDRIRSRVYYKLLVVCASTSSLVIGMAGPGAGASTVAVGVGTPLTLASVPLPPSQGSPLSAWDLWAAIERSDVSQIVNSGALLDTTVGMCTVNSDAVTQVTSTGGPNPYPAGVVTDTVGGSLTCSAVAGSTSRGVSPATTLACPVQAFGTYAPITDGYACVGGYSNNESDRVASYVNTSSSTLSGKVDLGAVGVLNPCGIGSLVASGSGTMPAHSGSTYHAIYAVSGTVGASNQWSSTYLNGGTEDWGTVCGVY